jgi:lipid-binding SYLF domain-containing protein
MISRRRALSLAFLSTLLAIGSSPGAEAVSEAAVDATLRDFHWRIGGSRELATRAAAVLVFPTIIKAGFGIGGEYGEGALLVRGRPVGHYNCVSASLGFQLGAQARSLIILFMTEQALAEFGRTDGWKVGTDRIRNPIVGFIFDNKGLMYNLTLEGTKISRISQW